MRYLCLAVFEFHLSPRTQKELVLNDSVGDKYKVNIQFYYATIDCDMIFLKISQHLNHVEKAARLVGVVTSSNGVS
tara:strand:+ start:899 stop:1126 length:228 start_codon:yes stop_codon:yes gene_type:complete